MNLVTRPSQLSKLIREGSSSFAYIYGRLEGKINTMSRRAAWFLPAAVFPSNEFQYKELVVSEEQNYSLGSRLDS